MDLIFTFGCGQNVADQKFIQEVENTSNRCNALEIRNMSLSFYAEYSRSNMNSKFLAAPKAIASLPLFSGDPPDTVGAGFYRARNGKDIIGFSLSGGFSAQGIFICPNDSKEEKELLKSFAGTMVPWKNGVYFWASWGVVRYKEYWNNPP